MEHFIDMPSGRALVSHVHEVPMFFLHIKMKEYTANVQPSVRGLNVVLSEPAHPPKALQPCVCAVLAC